MSTDERHTLERSVNASGEQATNTNKVIYGTYCMWVTPLADFLVELDASVVLRNQGGGPSAALRWDRGCGRLW
jgi:hypothetical protein